MSRPIPSLMPPLNNSLLAGVVVRMEVFFVKIATPWKAAFFAWNLATFLASPAFFGWSWDSIVNNSRAADFVKLCANPLARDLAEPILAYRLTLPILAWLLHLPVLAALILLYFFHLAFLAAAFSALRKRIDPVSSVLAVLILSLSFALFWSNWRPGFSDTFSHFMAALMLLSPGGVLVFSATLLGLFNDERMILVLPFIACWHFTPSWTVVWFKRVSLWAWPAIVGVLIYLIGRHALTVGWIGSGVVMPEVYTEIGENVWEIRPKLGSWSVWSLNVFLSFRWAWLILVLFAYYLILRKNHMFGGLFFAFFIFGVLASASVADVSRSIGYLWPAWVVAMGVLSEINQPRLKGLLYWILLGLVITPVFYTFENYHIHWFRPLPIVLMRCLGLNSI